MRRPMLKKVGLGLLGLVVLFLVVVALQPAGFRIERSTRISAPAPVIYALVTDFRLWDEWSPWAKLDPAMKKSLSGAAQGKGAIYEWSGNDDVGQGRMEIIETSPDRKVKIKLDFLAPFAASNTTYFELSPAGEAVTFTWAMTGTNDFMGKAFALVMDMDEMVGRDFEKGLSNLKGLAEREAKVAP